jgi:hypothetical protein
MSTIEVSCCVVDGTEKYAEFLMNSCSKLASGEHNIRYRAVLSGNKAVCPDGFEEVTRIDQVGNASENHALCLEEFCRQIDAEYHVVADTDVAVTMKDWDNLCISKMQGNVAAVGTAFPPDIRRYQDFPCLFFCMLRSDVLASIDIDWQPQCTEAGTIAKEVLEDKELAKGLAVPHRSIHKKDTAWKLRYDFARAGYSGIEFPMKYQTDNGALLPHLNKRGKKFYLDPKNSRWAMFEFHVDGELFATHLGAGRDRPFGGKVCEMWRPRVVEYVDRKYGIKL